MYVFRHRRWACAPAYSAAAGHSDRPCRGPGRRHADRTPLTQLMHSWHHGRMFGVRRPLRYLTWKLDLSDQQVREIAAVLNRLKTARAQTGVAWEGSVADIADTFTAAEFDRDKAQTAIDARKQSVGEQQDQVVDALRRLHAILDDEQRAEFAYLLRSGGLEI